MEEEVEEEGDAREEGGERPRKRRRRGRQQEQLEEEAAVGEGVCPFCHRHIGSFAHMAWECPVHERRRRGLDPQDALQRRLGWPTAQRGRKVADRRILVWLAELRQEVLELRFGRRAAAEG